MSEVTNNFYIKGNYIAQQHIDTQNITYTNGDGDTIESIYPQKNKYVQVVQWLEKQQSQGIDHYAAAGYNRSNMCRQLTKIFGWEVNENSLRKAQEEAEKQKK